MSGNRRPRAGFTLIELLTVIAIIAILVSLTAAGVMVVRNRGPRLQTSTEIGQLDTACKAFKAKFLMYPPSSIVLSGNAADYTSNASVLPSSTILASLWPKINFTSVANTLKLNYGINGAVALQGDQCLVLFLGGPPTTNGGLAGWSPDPTNPFDLTQANRDRFFEFNAARLKVLSGSFPSYVDPWGTNVPYAYFSSGRRLNGYNSVSPFDCQRLGISSGPYFTSAGPPIVFVNSSTCQIISAGQDGQFGTGGLINLQAPNLPLTATDDQTNFTSGLLGAGQ